LIGCIAQTGQRSFSLIRKLHSFPRGLIPGLGPLRTAPGRSSFALFTSSPDEDPAERKRNNGAVQRAITKASGDRPPFLPDRSFIRVPLSLGDFRARCVLMKTVGPGQPAFAKASTLRGNATAEDRSAKKAASKGFQLNHTPMGEVDQTNCQSRPDEQT